MKDLADLVQKTFYFGVGVASLAAEETTKNLKELGDQAQKLANELIDEGKIVYEKVSQDFDNVVGTENFGYKQNVSPQPSEKLKKKLLTLVKGNLDTALRLVDLEKMNNPGKSEDWYWEKAIYSYERDLD